jgi:hypothetical protein
MDVHVRRLSVDPTDMDVHRTCCRLYPQSKL